MDTSGFEPFEYLCWARDEMQGARHELCMSGIGAPTEEELRAMEEAAGHAPHRPDEAVTLYPEWCDRVRTRYGVPEGHVIITLGTSGGLFVALAALTSLLGDDSPVAIEHPAYGAFEAAARWLGRAGAELPVERLATERYALDPARVDAAFAAGARIVCVTDLHNPSGVALGKDAVDGLRAAARRHDGWVLIDEVYRDFAPGDVGTAYRAGERVVCTSSLTKCYGLGTSRAGWIVAPPEVIERADRIQEILHGVYPAPSLLEAVRGLRCADALLARARRTAARARPVIDTWIDTTPGVDWVPPDAGLTGLVRFEGLTDSRRFAARLRAELDLQTVAGAFFGAEGHLRLSFGLPPARLQAALDVLSLGMGPLCE